jgi:hypothetical protein
LLFDTNKPKDFVQPETLTDASAASKGTSVSVMNRFPSSSENATEDVAEVSDTVSIS